MQFQLVSARIMYRCDAERFESLNNLVLERKDLSTETSSRKLLDSDDSHLNNVSFFKRHSRTFAATL